MIARNIAPDKEGSHYGKYDTFHHDLKCAAKSSKVCKCGMPKVCIMSWQICMQIWQTIIGVVSIVNFSPSPSFSSC